MSVLILFCAVVIFSCIITNKFSNRIGMPALLFFMLLGILFGVDGIFKISFDNYELTSKLCSVGLLLIIFYGGFCTKKPDDKKTGIVAAVLSSFATFITAFLTAVFCHFVLKISVLESFLIGAVLSSTDAASVFSILRSKKLNLKYNTATLLEIESGSNDPFAYMLTILGLILINGQNSTNIGLMFLLQLGLGVLFGVLIAKAAILIFKKTKFISEGYDCLFVLAVALISFAVPDLLGGNGYLSVYLTGIILGNSEIKNKINLVYFFDGLERLAQVLIFFLLGLLSSPHKFFEIVFPATGIFLFLTFIARPFAVFLAMKPFKAKLRQIIFVSMTGLRGAASVVFAIMVAAGTNNFNLDIFHIVFFVCFASVAIQGSILPFLAKKLNMIDKFFDVLKTFNDYQKESAITLSKFVVSDNNPWINKQLKDINIPKDVLILLIKRERQKIVPKGDTVILKDDVVLLGSSVVHSSSDIKLREMEITENHEWKNKKIKDIDFQPDFLIALIKRAGNAFVPNGETTLFAGDVVVFYIV